MLPEKARSASRDWSIPGFPDFRRYLYVKNKTPFFRWDLYVMVAFRRVNYT